MRVIKSILLFIFIALAVVVFLELIPVAPKYPGENPWIIEKGARPLIIPHGGAKGLYPESSKYAFRKLHEDGADVFEVDLVLTKDGYLISHHDVTLNRTTGDADKIIDLTYNEVVQKFLASDFGSDFPGTEEYKEELVPATLNYLFTTYPEMLYLIEIKDTEENSGKATMEAAVAELLEVIEEFDMASRVMLSSFDDAVTKLIKDNGSLLTSTAVKGTLKFVLFSFLRLDFFYRPKDGALVIPIQDDLSDSQAALVKKIPTFIRSQLTTYDKDTDKYYTDIVKTYVIKDAHRHNMAVLIWTVNEKEEMRRLINMGVDGIITDRPDVLKELCDEMGLE